MTAQDPRPLTGDQVTITHGRYEATIAGVGASLRSLTVDGRNLVAPFDVDTIRPVFRGAILAPWPNRVVDGRYSFDGVAYQLALSEPDRGHALHGLLAWSRWSVVEATASKVRFESEVVPSGGYPFPLSVEVVYELDDDGLTTTVTATNTGLTDAPYGTAPHPYLVAGAGSVDDWTLTLPADRNLEVDERLSPVGETAVADLDFREPRLIGDLFIDHAFTALRRGEDQRARVTVTAPGGTGVAMSWGPELPWVQVHTADRPEAELNRRGLAVEPMTCPPDAFNSGTDLVRLAPGAAHTAAWTISAL